MSTIPSMLLRKRSLVVVAFAAALVLAAAGYALPAALSSYLLGPKMVRAEIVVKNGEDVVDFRLDRGRIVKPYAANTITLREGDGQVQRVPVASSADAWLNGRRVALTALKKGMQAVVARNGDEPADTVYAAGRYRVLRLPKTVINFVLGAKMMRGEIALRSADGVLHDYLLDRGRIRTISGNTLTLRERDDRVVTVTVAADARIVLNGKRVAFTALRRGMTATTLRDGNAAASTVYAVRRR